MFVVRDHEDKEIARSPRLRDAIGVASAALFDLLMSDDPVDDDEFSLSIKIERNANVHTLSIIDAISFTVTEE